MPRAFSARHPRLVRGTLLLFFFTLALAAGAAYGSWALVCRAGRCPTIAVLEDYTPRQTSKLYAADGRFVAEIGLERRTLIRLGDMPKALRDAFVITEDKRFFSHAGIDWRRVFGAGLRNIRAGSYAQGFSTVTMQLARNVFPDRITREKTLVRKLKEARVARDIEARYNKNKILELYLNQIYLGNGAYGVETASQRYFGKSARDLNAAEAATLAALPKAPERYNPRKYPDRAIQRRNTILELMRRERALGDADASLAKAYPLQLARKADAGDVAPYFVEWVRRQLDARFGQQLYEQGLKVYTTLDVEMQEAAERALEQQLRAIEGGRYGKFQHLSYEQHLARAAGNTDAGGAANSPYLQGAFVAIEPRTGAVRALVGGRDFDESKFNRATQALRQPGSTFKPIVYAAAVQSGRPLSFLLDDSPLAVPQFDGTEWAPGNYDSRFEGATVARRALYLSRNVPTVRLGMEIGERAVIETARRFGITTPIPAYPSIFLGSAEVYPIEMVASYSVFANLGARSTPSAILRVENAKGEVLWEPAVVQSPAMSPEETYIMVDAMKDVVRRGTGNRGVWSAGFRLPSGGKTGTTNDYTDVWYIGYTADLVAGVWMGMDRPQRIKSNAQGGELAAPAWTAFMKEVYRRKPVPPDWPRPVTLIVRRIDRTTGLISNPFCPTDVLYDELFIPGTEPVRECDVHSPFYVAPGDTLAPGGGPLTPTPLPPPDGTVPSGTTSGVRVSPGGAPVPQPSRPPPTARPPGVRDTSNPFYIPPRP